MQRLCSLLCPAHCWDVPFCFLLSHLSAIILITHSSFPPHSFIYCDELLFSKLCWFLKVCSYFRNVSYAFLTCILSSFLSLFRNLLCLSPVHSESLSWLWNSSSLSDSRKEPTFNVHHLYEDGWTDSQSTPLSGLNCSALSFNWK